MVLNVIQWTCLVHCITNVSEEAREVFKYGAARAGYWTGEKFMVQVERAICIAEFKYPLAMHTLGWLFDQSSCHRAYA